MRGKMETNCRKVFLIQRTSKITNSISLKVFALFLIFITNVNFSNCYSSVRRSGSVTPVINESRDVVEKNIKPNISPMLRPEKKSDENLETLSRTADDFNATNFSEEELNNIKFKPLDVNFKIPIVETQKSENHHEIKKKKLDIIKQLDDAIDLMENRDDNPDKNKLLGDLEEDILGYVDETLAQDHFNLFEGIKIEPVSSLKERELNSSFTAGAPRTIEEDSHSNGVEDFDNKIMRRLSVFAKTHKITVNVPEAARFFGFRYISSLWRKAGRYARRWLRSQRFWYPFNKGLGHRNQWSGRQLPPQKSWSQVTYSGPNNYIWPDNAQWPYGKNMWPNINYGGVAWPSVSKIWPNVQSISVESTTPATEIKRTSSTIAFGLKKLLLPIFIGAQIFKSVLIAMFLPSILGSFGKIIGKGLSQFSGASTNFGQTEVDTGEDVDFKEMGFTDQDSEMGYNYPHGGDNAVGTLPGHTLYGESSNNIANVAMSRFGAGGGKVTYVPSATNNFYTKVPFKKQEDFKVFHNIPSSSLLLSNYDPFYSPLLSRLDSVFQRLGLRGGTAGSQGASPSVERCREKLICLMYAYPAKYAPYSNLVSAQLSRELNELRRPSSDNQEILRFFRYMKAAKNGQEGLNCSKVYTGCPSLSAETGTAAMITTYNDINKLVGARKLE